MAPAVTVISLFALPTFYAIVDDWRLRSRARWKTAWAQLQQAEQGVQQHAHDADHED